MERLQDLKRRRPELVQQLKQESRETKEGINKGERGLEKLSIKKLRIEMEIENFGTA